MPATPDTSPANVARTLRECHATLLGTIAGVDAHKSLPSRVRALAEALEQQAAVTWEERVERACVEYYPTFGTREQMRPQMDAALRAAFPELVPSDDGEG